MSACTKSKSNAVILLIALSYLVILYFYDSYLFESTILIQNWIKTNKNLKKQQTSKELFHFDKIKYSNVSKEKLILYWKPFFGALYTTPHVCPGCLVTYDQSTVTEADAVVFHCSEIRDYASWFPWKRRSANQRWVWMCMEPPWNVRNVFQKTLTPLNDVFNWTMTYRVDSDVLNSYELVNFTSHTFTTMEIIKMKTASSLGAWVVSNCHASKRRNLIEELKKYVSIDEYGKCSKVDLCRDECQKDVISRYKFYFALENSHCLDYITEKFWSNALESKTVPVVMGPPRSEYELVAPPNSFIHVDDFGSVKELAEYLKKLDNHDELYAEYFKWWSNPHWKLDQIVNARKVEAKGLLNSRLQGTKVGICGLCQKLKHEPLQGQVEVVGDLDTWWYGKGYSPSKMDSITTCGRDESGFPLRWFLTLGYSTFFAFLAFLVYFLSRKLHKPPCCCW